MSRFSKNREREERARKWREMGEGDPAPSELRSFSSDVSLRELASICHDEKKHTSDRLTALHHSLMQWAEDNDCDLDDLLVVVCLSMDWAAELSAQQIERKIV